MEQKNWEDMSKDEKNTVLYWRQKEILDAFLERNAISKDQYEKSLGDLTKKMRIGYPAEQ